MKHHLNSSTEVGPSIIKVIFPPLEQEYFKLNTAKHVHIVCATKMHQVDLYSIKWGLFWMEISTFSNTQGKHSQQLLLKQISVLRGTSSLLSLGQKMFQVGKQIISAFSFCVKLCESMMGYHKLNSLQL